MTKNLITQYQKARAAATPLIAISTPDPAETMRLIQSNMKDGGKNVPLAKWDCVGGAVGLNTLGASALKEVCKGNPPDEVVNPVDILVFSELLPAKSVLFMLNAHSYFRDQDPKQYIQALWNLRDVFKSKFCTIVLLGPSFVLPAELKQDIYTIDSPYPDEAELREMVTRISSHNKVSLDESKIENTIDALRGLAPFPAETALAMEMSKAGIDSDGVWGRKRNIVESYKGLSVFRSEKGFKLGGLKHSQDFFAEYMNGLNKPRAIVFIDEIEKSVLGSGTGDSNGIGADILGLTCTKMEDNGWTGSILYGHAGTGKTQLAKILGNWAGVPTIYFDLNGMKGGIVGETEGQVRENYKVLEAIAQDRALFIATCNEINPLKPELRRRFGLPVFFFDLLTDEERMAVKQIYSKKYNFDMSVWDSIDDNGWTGAEIEKCCLMAYWMRTTPDKTAKYIVPIARSNSKEIQRRREDANGKYLSASYEGIYRMDTNPLPVYDIGGTNRTVEFEN